MDWYWLPSLFGALRFLRREKPDVVVLQWWTGTVLHSFLALAIAARRRGARIVIEFHESLDTAEDKFALFSRYVNLVAPRLFRMADQYVVHSEFDRNLIVERFGLPAEAFHVVPHASYDTYADSSTEVHREAPDGVVNLLYFGIIRPFKGVEDLVRAYEGIPDDQAGRFWLTVVGETWEGHTLPTELIAASPRRDRITVVNRYVQDDEVDGFFRGADVVVLPYHRSSMSGPLQRRHELRAARRGDVGGRAGRGGLGVRRGGVRRAAGPGLAARGHPRGRGPGRPGVRRDARLGADPCPLRRGGLGGAEGIRVTNLEQRPGDGR